MATCTTTFITMSYAPTITTSKDVYWYLPWKPPVSMTKPIQPPTPVQSPPPPTLPEETNDRQLPLLPLELLLQVAEQLIPSSRTAEDFQPHTTAAEEGLSYTGTNDFTTVLNLSSTSTALRRLLAPLIWQDVTFRRPDHLGKLRSLMDYYQRLASSASEIGRLVYPLPLVRSLRVLMPDQYQSLDQEILRHLIRSGINPLNNLHTLEWDAEMLPGPMVWRMIGSDKMPGLEEILAERKDRTLTRDRIRQVANSGGATALYSYTPPTRLQGGDAGENTPGESSHRSSRRESPSSSSRSSSPQADTPGLQTLSLSCRVFYGGNIDMSRLRSLRHLKLTSYDSHLLPPHLPSLLLSLHRPLESISLSTSKTSLLHDVDLIQRGCFRRLKSLDIFAVTPEWPLCEGLRSAGKSLKHLRLILDVSGSFSNFDNLFRDLAKPESSGHGVCQGPEADSDVDDDSSHVHPVEPAPGIPPSRLGTHTHKDEGRNNTTGNDPLAGALPHLETLTIDPFPQQNTAPSFTTFLQSCPNLKVLNGRRLDLLPPGLEMWDFTPERPSGALFY